MNGVLSGLLFDRDVSDQELGSESSSAKAGVNMDQWVKSLSEHSGYSRIRRRRFPSVGTSRLAIMKLRRVNRMNTQSINGHELASSGEFRGGESDIPRVAWLSRVVHLANSSNEKS